MAGGIGLALGGGKSAKTKPAVPAGLDDEGNRVTYAPGEIDRNMEEFRRSWTAPTPG